MMAESFKFTCKLFFLKQQKSNKIPDEVLTIIMNWDDPLEFHLVEFWQFINKFTTVRLLSLGQGRGWERVRE